MSMDGEQVLFGVGADPADFLDAFAEMTDAVTSFGEGIASLTDAVSPLDDIAELLDFIAGDTSQLAAGMEDLAAKTQEAGDSAGGLSERLGGLQEGLEGAIERATDLAGAFLEFQAIGGAMEAVQNFAGNMIGINTQFQQLGVTLKNFVGQQQANGIVDWARNYAATIPFTTSSTLQAVVAITALGQNAEQVIPSLATVAAQMGSDMPTAVMAFTDAYNGRWLVMQNQLHITKDDLIPFGLQVDSTGHVLNDSFVPAFEKFSATRFPTALSDDMQTFGGMLSEADDKIQLLAGQIGAPLFDEFQQGLGAAMTWVDNNQGIINTLATNVGQGLAAAFKGLGDVVSFAWPYLKDIGQTADDMVTGGFHTLMQWVQQGTQWWDSLAGGVQAVETPIATLATVAGTAGTHAHDFATGLGAVQTKLETVQGPLQPVLDLFKQLGGVMQEVEGFFAPVPASTEKVTSTQRELITTKDGMKEWADVTTTSLVNLPSQASGFEQFLDSLKTNFLDAFNDSNGQKAHDFAQALKDAGDALVSTGEWLASTGLQTLQTTATVLGDIAGAAASFFQTLQDHHAELDAFRVTLDIIGGIIAANLLTQLATFAAGILTTGINAATAAANGIAKLISGVKSVGQWVGDAAGALSDQFSPAAATAGDDAEASSGQIDTLAASEEAVSTDAEASVVQLSLFSDAELEAGTSAVEASGELDGLAASEAAAGTAAEGAAGAAGAAGGIGAGILGLGAAIGVVGAAANLASTQGMEALISNLTGLPYQATDPIAPLQDLWNWITNTGDASSGASGGLGQLGQGLLNVFDNAQLLAQSGIWVDLDGNILQLGNYADETAQSLHNLDMAWAATLALNSTPGNLPSGTAGTPHAQGGVVGPNEMLSLLNDAGGAGELVKLPSGSIVFPHDQSVSMLDGPMVGGIPLSLFGALNGGGGFSGSNISGLLQQLISSVNRLAPLTGQPVQASTGSTFNITGTAANQQLSSSELQTLAALLNRLQGRQLEWANLGAAYPF